MDNDLNVAKQYDPDPNMRQRRILRGEGAKGRHMEKLVCYLLKQTKAIYIIKITNFTPTHAYQSIVAHTHSV